MNEAEAIEIRRRRWPRALGLLGLGLALLAGLIWLQRLPIATRFVDRELAKAGVPARYTIETVGLRRQRLSNVVIGDPKRPDLVADWIEVETVVGLDGISVTGLSVGTLRARGQLVDGRVSLGALDRLLPKPTGKGFALPAIDLDLQDARLALATPQGPVALALTGKGLASDGFAGRLTAASPRLSAGGCAATGLRAALDLTVRRARPRFAGPLAADALDCGDVAARRLEVGTLDVTLSAALDAWTGSAGRVSAQALDLGGERRATGLAGQVSFAGDRRGTQGRVDLGTAGIALPGFAAKRSRIVGAYRIGRDMAFTGRASASGITADAALLARIDAAARSTAATPVGPLVARLATASRAAWRDLGVEADIAAVQKDGRGAATIRRLVATGAAGARASLEGEGVRIAWPGGGVTAGGIATLNGGGLPDLRAAFGLTPDGAVTGTATVAPYAAGTALLALDQVSFRIDGGSGRLTTRAALSGPLPGGRVDGLTLPIDARWGRSLTVNPGCTPVGWRRLAVSGLVLDPARLNLCAIGPALVAGSGGGARVATPRLTGRIGSSPLTLAASSASFRLNDMGFAASDVAARIGVAERATLIDAQSLSGRVANGAAAGVFAGGSGRIGTVPLLLSEAAGDWRFARGTLTLSGALAVADAAEEDRFNPLRSGDVALTLAGNAIRATATLVTPKDGSRVTTVAIDHDLSAGTGRARLAVPGIVFNERGLQPSDLTPLTFGVIAAVKGIVTGEGDIAWTPQGVTSTGRFATDNTDLAAAFGPVTGIKGELAFTDLLGLVSAPGQVATVATVNPGIAVENGTVRYQLIGGTSVRVLGARWPFAGGELILDPTVLDFGENTERRMTFRVVGADAGAFLQQFDFDNLNATGTFDGVLPMIFDERGGRIEGGRLVARGGGSLAYLGTLTQEDLGFWGDLAFQALKALDYRALTIGMDGPLAGEMVTQIRFAGVSQGKGTKSNFIIRRLAKLPFVFNVTVRAPFRQLIDSVQSFYDPSRLIERNLPSLLEEQRRRTTGQLPPLPPVQPPESEKRP